MRTRGRALRLALVVCLAVGVLGSVGGGVYAAFYSTTSNSGSSFNAKRIFPGLRTMSSWQISDQADTSASNESDTFLAVDAVEYRTLQNVATGSNDYVDVDFYASRPAGLSVSSPQATIAIASQGGAGSGNACYWFEVRRASTNALLATHGSYASAVSCSVGTTQAAVSTAIASVTSTDIVNDLRLRIYPWETSGAKRADIDQVIVTGSTPYTTFEAYEKQVVDVTGAATTTPWGLATSDGTSFYESGGNWAAAFAANRYVNFTVKPFVPTGSVITSASFTHSYRSRDAGSTTCWYFETYQNTTLIAAHGSTVAPISCNASNVTWVTETTPIGEVDTVAEANALVIRVYMRNSATRRSQHDIGQVSFDYYLD
jgi:hypothetical protein